MNATDLMIGDWVCFDGDTSHECPVQIDGISKEEAGVDGDWYDIWEPIPLTPEILEKNGFKYSEWYGWQIKEPEFTLCFVGDTPHFLLDDIFVCDCPYVHTLQHALKLCEIEKEVVL